MNENFDDNLGKEASKKSYYKGRAIWTIKKSDWNYPHLVKWVWNTIYENIRKRLLGLYSGKKKSPYMDKVLKERKQRVDSIYKKI